MTATIQRVDVERRIVFGLAAGPVSDDFYDEIRKTCSGSTCAVGDNVLVEFALLDRQKQQVIGMGDGPTGYWLGVKIRDDTLWQEIINKQVTEFDIWLSNGVQIDFGKPLPRTKVDKSLSDTKGMVIEMSLREGGEVFKLDQGHPDYSFVAKCVAATQTGNFGTLERRCFEKALDSISKQYAEEIGVDRYTAYDTICRSELGSKLLAASFLAPVGHTEVPVTKQQDALGGSGGKAWTQIEKLAKERRQQMAYGISEAAAVTAILSEFPDLYSRYLMENVQDV